jgi:hypothetical protein
MQNITYEISENNNTEVKEPINIDSLMEEIALQTIKDTKQDDIMYAIQVEYESNYNVKQLGLIMDYYELPKRKLRKDEMVQMIMLYECEPTNALKVKQRKRLWTYVSELKKDKFFNKYLLIDL